MTVKITDEEINFQSYMDEFEDSEDPFVGIKKKYGWEILCDLEGTGSDIGQDLLSWLNKGQGKSYEILFYDVFIMYKENK